MIFRDNQAGNQKLPDPLRIPDNDKNRSYREGSSPKKIDFFSFLMERGGAKEGQQPLLSV